MDEIEKKLNFIADKLGYKNFVNSYREKLYIRSIIGDTSYGELTFTIGDNIKQIVLDNEKLIYKISNHKTVNIINVPSTYSYVQYLNNYIFKLVDYKKSSNIFGYKNIKKEIFTNQKPVKISNIYLDYKCKKDGIVRDIIEISVNGRNLKMLASEVSPIYPDIDKLLKGYNVKKNRKITIGDTVYVKHHKVIPYKEKCVALKLMTSSNRIKILSLVDSEIISESYKEYYKVEYNKNHYIVDKKKLIKA